MKQYISDKEISYTFDQLQSVIESIVKRRVGMILKSERESANRITAIDISNMVESLINDAGEDTKKAIKSSKKEDEALIVDAIAQENDKLRRVDSGRRVWTKEKCKLFILDRDTKGKSKTAQLWGIKEASV